MYRGLYFMHSNGTVRSIIHAQTGVYHYDGKVGECPGAQLHAIHFSLPVLLVLSPSTMKSTTSWKVLLFGYTYTVKYVHICVKWVHINAHIKIIDLQPYCTFFPFPMCTQKQCSHQIQKYNETFLLYLLCTLLWKSFYVSVQRCSWQ